jgi:hypothetical protein
LQHRIGVLLVFACNTDFRGLWCFVQDDQPAVWLQLLLQLCTCSDVELCRQEAQKQLAAHVAGTCLRVLSAMAEHACRVWQMAATLSLVWLSSVTEHAMHVQLPAEDCAVSWRYLVILLQNNILQRVCALNLHLPFPLLSSGLQYCLLPSIPRSAKKHALLIQQQQQLCQHSRWCTTAGATAAAAEPAGAAIAPNAVAVTGQAVHGDTAETGAANFNSSTSTQLNELATQHLSSAAVIEQPACQDAVSNLAGTAMTISESSPGASGCVQSLVVQLGSSDPSDRFAAAEQLWRMSHAHPVVEDAIAAMPAVLSTLVALLGTQSSSDVQQAAADALQALAYDDPAYRAAIATVPGALSSLAALLSTQNSSYMQQAAASALLTLPYDNPANRAAIAEVPGALSSLVALLSRNNSSVVQQAAATALCILADDNPANQAAIATVPGVLSSLAALLGSNSSSGVKRAAAGALWSLASDPAKCAAI